MGASAAAIFSWLTAPIAGPSPPPPPPPPPPPTTNPLPSRPPAPTGAQLQEGLARSAGRWVHDYVIRGVPAPEEFWDRIEAEQDALN
ncbi:hypothetical protein GRF29_8g3480209 [Pseudopithomyces chartarum]|uniref:Uncharacterized protein n=1 Tax=Pseudopithomyces chartarum TaxID=1892770 RepID=A0AAN6M661_9PLEO|nr:hypothetical protein GRF29_8g3480209 [Pseudopithomyces chartarum]